ncbi:hypothetical protein Tco_1578188 [Tanacetum coccineum]
MLYGRKCRSLVLWAKVGEHQLISPKMVQETTFKVVQIKERLKAARDHQKSYADNRRKPLEFEWVNRVFTKSVTLEGRGPVAYRLRLPQELSSIHDTFHVSNLKNCLADANLHVAFEEITVDNTICFVKEPVEIMDYEVKKLKRSRIPIVKTTFTSSEQVEVLGNDTGYTIQSIQHPLGPGHPNTFHYSYSDESDEDEPSKVLQVQKSINPLSGSPTPSPEPIVESLSPSLTPCGDKGLLNDEIPSDLPSLELNNDPGGDILFLENLLKDESLEANKSEINPLIWEPPNTILMRDEEIELNSHKDIDDLVPILKVSEKPLDSLDYNPIFGIHNKESDESEMETIMDEVQNHSPQSTA